MTLSPIFKRLEQTLTANSPHILTGIGVTGVVATAMLTGRASVKAAQLLAQDEEENGARELRSKFWQRNLRTIAPLYIPPVLVGGITIASILGANQIGVRRAAAMATAYSISERAFEEYRHKVTERLGPGQEQKVRDEIAQDRITANPPSKSEIIITGRGEVLCYDAYTGRYFQSSMETLRRAQNDLNHSLLTNDYASLGDFYELIGLGRTGMSEDVGWTSSKMLELAFSTTISDDDRPCISVAFGVPPVRNFHRFS